MDNVLYDSFVGIDIAKLKFDVAVCLADKKVKYKTFDNNPKGYEAFHQWLMQFGKQPLTLMEATGIYHEALADFLYANGVAVAVINPKCTPNIAKSANIRSKTDQTDAKLLAEFARKLGQRAVCTLCDAPAEVGQVQKHHYCCADAQAGYDCTICFKASKAFRPCAFESAIVKF